MQISLSPPKEKNCGRINLSNSALTCKMSENREERKEYV